MTRILLKQCIATLLFVFAGPGIAEEPKSLPELPTLGDDPVPAPATQVKPYGGPAPNPAADSRVAGFEEMQQAREAFEEFIRAYETGNIVLIQRRLDPAMIGYQQFLDGVRSDAATLRQTRMRLIDTQITVGPEVAVIQTGWEKRALSAATFQPQLKTGNSQILLHRGKDGWRLVAIAGDNLFSSTGTLAQLVNTANFKAGPIGLTEARAIGIQITDPDLAGLANVTVRIRSSEGDAETITLPAVSAGVFRTLIVTVRFNNQSGAFVSGNGVLEYNILPTVFTITYVDTLPAATVAGIFMAVP